MKSVKWAFALAVTCAVASITPALADKCRPTPLLSLDVAGLDHGRMLIPAKLASADVYLVVDTGSAASSLEAGFIEAMKLPRYGFSNSRIESVTSGEKLKVYVGVTPMEIGGLKRTSESRFLEVPAWKQVAVDNRKVVGTFAHDFLNNYDVEMDFKGRKLVLYQKRCREGVVHWANEHALIPFQDRFSAPVVTVTVEGKKISASFGTERWRSVIDLERAERSFGLKPGSPGVTAEGTGDDVEYSHTFKSLALGGIDLGESDVELADLKFSSVGGTLDMLLGLKEISQLHLYIAYRNEKKIYVTRADGTL